MDDVERMTDDELIDLQRDLRRQAADLRAEYGAQRAGNPPQAARKDLSSRISATAQRLGQVEPELRHRGLTVPE